MNEETCACCPYHFTAEIQRGSTCRDVPYCYLAFKEGRKSRTAVLNYTSCQTVKVKQCAELKAKAEAEGFVMPKLETYYDSKICSNQIRFKGGKA
ncbi:hypothetical protein J6C36_05180 [Methanocorpusculaceae archaeon]|nr:hypothetical protein [Methanocorpusculaceae archaeon]MBO5118628.1 hypothetical protein [Methanocorpusculum sp.]MBO5368612.1 hypothetical protein [Methanocorpusculum sp.]MBO5430663.1 hypothetical protein [Methanocorpusculum sp.]MBP3443117.1 hypothetical protein [Methanocorpusculaceae archaeon]